MKRVLLCIAAILLFCISAQATTFSVVAHTSAGSTDTNAVISSGIDTTGADLIFLGVSDYGATTDPGCTPTDSKSNTWNALTTYNTAGLLTRVKIWWSRTSSVGAGHTFSCSASSTYPSITVLAVSGSASLPFDQQNGDATLSSNDVLPGPITPTQDNEIVVTVMTSVQVFTDTIDSGFTITDEQDYSDMHHVNGAMAYIIQTTAGSTDPKWSSAGFAESAAIASFKVNTGGGGGPTGPASRKSLTGAGQ